jgi:uncharacterized repeat protein (TIGR01451 family)
MYKAIALSVLILLTSWSARAVENGAAGLEIKATAQVEVVVKGPDGKEQTRLVPAGKVTPGSTVVYTLEAHNKSGKPAADVIVTDPIPAEVEFVDNTSNGARVSFSVDGGKTWGAKESLKVKGTDGAMRTALPADFTHIRWEFEKPIAPGESRAVSFRAKVE